MEKPEKILEYRLKISGTARLSLRNGAAGVVRFNFTAVDGLMPTCGEILGDDCLLDAAWHAGRATLAMFNTTFAVKLIGKSDSNGALIVVSKPIFRALAASAKKADRDRNITSCDPYQEI